MVKLDNLGMQLIIVAIKGLLKVRIMHFVGGAYSFRVIMQRIFITLVLSFVEKRFGSDKHHGMHSE